MCFTFLSAVSSKAVGDALLTDKQSIQKILPENFKHLSQEVEMCYLAVSLEGTELLVEDATNHPLLSAAQTCCS